MDILPTMAELAGGKVPADRIIDGKDIFDLMTDENTKTPHKVFYYYQKEQLMAVRSGPWKLHLALDKQYKSVHYPGFKKGRPLKLVNLDHDIQEQYDVSQKHPDIVKRLQKLADAAREDLGDLGVQGKNQRPAAIVDHPVAQLKK
jgi:arylsulfatase A-like enzyme